LGKLFEKSFPKPIQKLFLKRNNNISFSKVFEIPKNFLQKVLWRVPRAAPLAGS